MSDVLLVGIECSACGERALQYAAEWAESAKRQLTLAHVIQWSPFSFSTAKEKSVGKTGASGIRAQLFGSVAHALAQISKQPVTVVP
jgi:nucleotide-binding universal stress UspA family protein